MATLTVWFASFAGRCGLCDKDIDEGDECCMVDDEAVHASCARDHGYETDAW